MVSPLLSILSGAKHDNAVSGVIFVKIRVHIYMDIHVKYVDVIVLIFSVSWLIMFGCMTEWA